MKKTKSSKRNIILLILMLIIQTMIPLSVYADTSPDTASATAFIDSSNQECGDRVIVEPDGNILVSISYNGVINRYAQNGSYIETLPIGLNRALALDIGPDGTIYDVGVFYDISVFDHDTNLAYTIGTPNDAGGDFGRISALYVKDASTIYSVSSDTGLYEIDVDVPADPSGAKADATGIHLATPEDLGLSEVEDIQKGPDSSFYISGYVTEYDSDTDTYESTGKIVKVTLGETIQIQTVYETNVALGRMEIKPDGSIYFIDNDNQLVKRLNTVGTVDVVAYGSLLNSPSDVTFASGGDLLISNFYGDDIGSIVTKAPDPAVAPGVKLPSDSEIDVIGVQAGDEVNFYTFDGESFELEKSVTAEGKSVSIDNTFDGDTVYVSYTRDGAESGLREFSAPDKPDPGADQPILSVTETDVHQGESGTLSINKESGDYVETAVIAAFFNGEFVDMKSIEDFDEEELTTDYTWDDMAEFLGSSDELDVVFRVYEEEPGSDPSIDDEDYLDQVQITYYAAEAEQPPDNGGSSPHHPSSPQPSTTDVAVNGQSQSAGTETRTTENGATIANVNINGDTVRSMIESIAKETGSAGDNTITVPVSDTSSDVARVNLTGDVVKELENNSFHVSVKQGTIEYNLPAADLTIDQVAKDLGVDADSLKNIDVEIQIVKVSDSVAAQYEKLIKESGSELILPPVQFEVTANTTNADGKEESVSIDKFSTYVERTMEIPAGIDPSKVTTGIVFNADGTFEHVPTVVYQENGKWYARLNSLTNSDYSVIWNPVTVTSVENHWSKDAVNDMASRLIIKNPDTFDPKKNITRGEFAEYITKALGLYRTGVAADGLFIDVAKTNEFADAVKTSVDYGIIKGYADGSFKPDAAITREEAMVMYSRAMKIAGLAGTDMNRINHYSDFASIASWAKENVRQVVAAKVFNGVSDTKLAPKAKLTLAEASTAIRNLLIQSGLIGK